MLVAAASLLVAACKDGNPVALPTGPGGGTANAVTVTTDVKQVEARSINAVTLSIVATGPNGAAPADGTIVTLNTSLGHFAVDAMGKPIQLTTRPLSGGRATVQFFAGSEVGVANILASVGTAIGTLNLPIVEPPPIPVPDFTFSASGLSVLFTDTSTGSPTSYRWNFGDGTESTERNPMHTYPTAGSYAVTLVVRNGGGEANVRKFVEVSLGTAPTAAFSFEVSGAQVNFVDKSTGNPTSWTWTFGDGTSSTVRNPVKAYPDAGSYTVTLTASNAAGSNSTSQVVVISPGTKPTSVFTFTASGRQVNFVDQSTGNPSSWFWDFGDGTTSTTRNPVKTYAAAGSYTVTLTVANAAGSHASSQVVVIAAGTPPVAKFEFAVNQRVVNFLDKSTGSPTSWSWSFGDGGSSTQQNPVYTYSAPGNYTVTLTVTNAAGSSSTNQVVTIATGAAPQANFTYGQSGMQVNFLDRSTGSPTSWTWEFGDGTFSSDQNPVKVYANPGTYTVVLTAANSAGFTRASSVVTVPPPSN